jgi:hypothetical protein
MANKKIPSTPDILHRLRNIQLDLSAVEYKDAIEFKAAYDSVDQAVKDAANGAVDKQADVIIALAKMRSVLSQRSAEKLRKEAGVTRGWTQYFAWFKRTYQFPLCLRTVINKIDRLGGKRFCASCGKAKGHTPTCPRYIKPAPLLSSRECQFIGGLTLGYDLVKAVENGGNIQEAARGYRLIAPTPQELRAWTDQQRIPYSPTIGDVIKVSKKEFAIREICELAETDHSYVLTIVLDPLGGTASNGHRSDLYGNASLENLRNQTSRPSKSSIEEDNQSEADVA